jgi:hypothetical protein
MFRAVGFEIKFLARPEVGGVICRTPTADNAAQELYFDVYQ